MENPRSKRPTKTPIRIRALEVHSHGEAVPKTHYVDIDLNDMNEREETFGRIEGKVIEISLNKTHK